MCLLSDDMKLLDAGRAYNLFDGFVTNAWVGE